MFAAALPYTNPYRYNHYVISLAHHVIAGWFLKSRQKFRYNFVKYIVTGLDQVSNRALLKAVSAHRFDCLLTLFLFLSTAH